MAKSRQDRRYDAMSSDERRAAIKRLERERLDICAEIESILRIYAKESGNRALARRRYKFGDSPNDWSGEDGAI